MSFYISQLVRLLILQLSVNLSITRYFLLNRSSHTIYDVTKYILLILNEFYDKPTNTCKFTRLLSLAPFMQRAS